MLVRIGDNPGCLMKHLRLILTSQINCITHCQYIQSAVITKIHYLLNIQPLIIEWVGLGCFDKICFGIQLY